MNEEDARDWVRNAFGADAIARLERFGEILLAEAERQSLIARSTFSSLWSRHLCDSAQLVSLAPSDGLWLDVGSGGGLPGIVVALLRDATMMLVETRRKRVEFLQRACGDLGLTNVAVVQADVRSVQNPAAVISARAVARLSDLFAWTAGAVSRETLYLLPRGANVVSDLAEARRSWQGAFHVKQSITEPSAGIVVATGVRPL